MGAGQLDSWTWGLLPAHALTDQASLHLLTCTQRQQREEPRATHSVRVTAHSPAGPAQPTQTPSAGCQSPPS